jgi:hypothetical protein
LTTFKKTRRRGRDEMRDVIRVPSTQERTDSEYRSCAWTRLESRTALGAELAAGGAVAALAAELGGATTGSRGGDGSGGCALEDINIDRERATSTQRSMYNNKHEVGEMTYRNGCRSLRFHLPS